MAYQINLTGQEIDERLQNIGTAEDVAAADGTLYARISKNADDVDELRDTVGHIDSAQTATDKTVAQHTADISTLQTAVDDVKKDVEYAGQAIEMTSASVKFATDPTNTVAIFKIDTNIGAVGSLCFAGDSHIDYTFKLFRHTGCRYEEYPLWVDVDDDSSSREKIPYTILVDKTSIDTFKTLNIQYRETTETLGYFIKNHSKRKKWAIQAYVNGYPYTPLFEFAMSEREITLRYDFYGTKTDSSCQLEKNNGSRFTPRRQNIRLAYAYNSYNWDKVGDVEDGLITKRIYCFSDSKESSYYKMPVAGDIVRRGHTEGTVMYVNQKADGTVEMVWSEDKKVYTMEFSTYIFNKRDTRIKCPGMRITKAATLICDDITNQTKGGTLRDLYISAGAKYNEATGFYELNGLTDITEEEMRVIWQEDLSGWYLKGRTNLTRNIGERGNAGGYNGGIDICNICHGNSNITKFNFGQAPFARYLDNAFSGCTKLETIDTRFPITPYGGVVGPNIFRDCLALKEVRFNTRYINYSTKVYFPASPLISKDSVLSVIETTKTEGSVKPLVVVGLNESAYNRLKDDTDITAALTEKNGFVTLIQI